LKRIAPASWTPDPDIVSKAASLIFQIYDVLGGVVGGTVEPLAEEMIARLIKDGEI
jgi:hypothetical protein